MFGYAVIPTGIIRHNHHVELDEACDRQTGDVTEVVIASLPILTALCCSWPFVRSRPTLSTSP